MVGSIACVHTKSQFNDNNTGSRLRGCPLHVLGLAITWHEIYSCILSSYAYLKIDCLQPLPPWIFGQPPSGSWETNYRHWALTDLTLDINWPPYFDTHVSEIISLIMSQVINALALGQDKDIIIKMINLLIVAWTLISHFYKYIIIFGRKNIWLIAIWMGFKISNKILVYK